MSNILKILNGSQLLRNDSAGQGHFGSSRGERIHKGIDIITTPGENVLAPFDGKIKKGLAYNNDSYRIIDVSNSEQKIRIFYAEPLSIITNDEFVTKGTLIGISQDVSERYPKSSMKPHLHIELYEKVNNKWELKDPTDKILYEVGNNTLEVESVKDLNKKKS